MKKYEFLKQLADKPANQWTEKQKEIVAADAKKNGIHMTPGCPDCYRDAAMQLYLKLKPKPEPKNAGGFALQPGIDITLDSFKYGKFRVCEATLTAENARKWLKAGIPRKFFAQIPEGE